MCPPGLPPYPFPGAFQKKEVTSKDKTALPSEYISNHQKENTNMETATATQTEQPKNVVLSDVLRSENDVYRITLTEFKGERYLDLRIFFRSKEDAALFIPTSKGVCFPEKLREEVIAGLIMARVAPVVERAEGEIFSSVKICEIPISETECWRISKGAGAKNTFCDIRKFIAQKDGAFFPSKTKGVSILGTSLQDVILGLMRTEPEHLA